MNNRRYWLTFFCCSLFWLSLPTVLCPQFSGVDVFVFRDAGWNLASAGSFTSRGLPYDVDLSPHLYGHYTPMMPLLFAAFCSVFPRNAAAGDIFNTLLGIIAAWIVLGLLLKQDRKNWRHTLTALVISAIPTVFVTFDRPEAIGIALFAVTMMLAWSADLRAATCGALVALTFLAHPFAGVLAGMWCVMAFAIRRTAEVRRWKATAQDIAKMLSSAAALLALVTILFYELDRSSLKRFSAHALGGHSGLGAAHSQSFVASLRQGMGTASAGAVVTWGFAGFVLCNLALLYWILRNPRKLTHKEWTLAFAAFGSSALSIAAFPSQHNYLHLVLFLIPIGLLAARESNISRASVGIMLLVCSWQLPLVAFVSVSRFAARHSFSACREQPNHLLAQLPSRRSLVVIDGSNYDLYKPVIPNLVRSDYFLEPNDSSSIDGIVNCYSYFHGAADAEKPLPKGFSLAQFHKIEASPDHHFLMLFGHKLMRSQQGWGCDLYLRNPEKEL